jgi:hypothetical protein
MQVSGQLHASVAPRQKKSLRYTLNRGQGGFQSRSRHFTEEEDPLLLKRTETKSVSRPNRSLVKGWGMFFWNRVL